MGGYTADRAQRFTDGDAHDVAESVCRGEARGFWCGSMVSDRLAW